MTEVLLILFLDDLAAQRLAVSRPTLFRPRVMLFLAFPRRTRRTRRSGTRGTSDDAGNADPPPRPVAQARGARPPFAPRPAAPDRYLVPDDAAHVEEEVVEDGQDPRGDVDDGQDELGGGPRPCQLCEPQR